MLLIYTHKITPRFTYIMKHIFNKMLLVEITFTTKIEEFIAHSGPKITYTKQPLQSEFFIKSHELLFEQGLNDYDIKIQDWAGTPCFFTTSDKSSLPFDVFAASFYFLSRYEEYLPHVKDEHGRYPFQESLGFKNNFLQTPVVDIWISKLKKALLERFPDMVFGTKEYNQLSLIDVAVSSEYTGRGIIRTLAGYLLDIGRFRLSRVWNRTLVLLTIRKDPFNNFNWLISLHKKAKAKAIFFFLLADYATYDKNISINHNQLRNLIKKVADYNIVSLMASYKSVDNLKTLKKERRRLIEIINRPVKRIRYRYNRLIIPETYQNLVEVEFNEDYSMGYDKALGFRAGTCTPFYFFDLSHETQLPVKVNPFCVHTSALNLIESKEIDVEIQQLKETVQTVNGNFTTVFLNDYFGVKTQHNWKETYKKLIEV